MSIVGNVNSKRDWEVKSAMNAAGFKTLFGARPKMPDGAPYEGMAITRRPAEDGWPGVPLREYKGGIPADIRAAAEEIPKTVGDVALFVAEADGTENTHFLYAEYDGKQRAIVGWSE